MLLPLFYDLVALSKMYNEKRQRLPSSVVHIIAFLL